MVLSFRHNIRCINLSRSNLNTSTGSTKKYICTSNDLGANDSQCFDEQALVFFPFLELVIGLLRALSEVRVSEASVDFNSVMCWLRGRGRIPARH